MTPFVAKKIKHNGMEPVVVFSENKIENKKPKIRKRSPNT
jgi:hypothetical protein